MIGNLNNDKSTGQGPQFTNVVNRSSEDSTKRQHLCIACSIAPSLSSESRQNKVTTFSSGVVMFRDYLNCHNYGQLFSLFFSLHIVVDVRFTLDDEYKLSAHAFC